MPMAACVLLLLTLTFDRSPGVLTLAANPNSSSMLAAALSNQLYAAYLPATGHSDHNLPSVRMRSTKLAHSRSPIPSGWLGSTNLLVP